MGKIQKKLNGQKDKNIGSTTCGGPTRRSYHRRRRGHNRRPLLSSLSHIWVQILFIDIHIHGGYCFKNSIS
ncbi:LOW QUALITY PROTEIN: uncharacterized protein LOC111830438 [Capsella rubella]|uniref:LOW QUALITY PROTEIN: uncharacterized protein LOC111830438 n=1 Tax=Capsella rubella TaxID=81985 RepID=UPI000CD560B7|nr:LOW QUALITY PROTEIN: uncharacterized protein LOC111830438 [Capsella rubella]